MTADGGLPMPARRISRDDIMDVAAYGKVRDERRRRMAALKKDRRIAVGPDVTLHFESYETMWHQVHEMLAIEKGGEAQIADELAAYNPLIPQGRELVATMMIEIDDAVRRARDLLRLGGIEETATLEIGGDAIRAIPENDAERTTADGKTSSVHFLRFPLSDAQAARFKAADAHVILAIGHANYGHMAVMPAETRAALAADLD